jgi:hypothetical protein
MCVDTDGNLAAGVWASELERIQLDPLFNFSRNRSDTSVR